MCIQLGMLFAHEGHSPCYEHGWASFKTVRALLLDSRFLESLALEWPTARLAQLLDQFSSRLALFLDYPYFSISLYLE